MKQTKKEGKKVCSPMLSMLRLLFLSAQSNWLMKIKKSYSGQLLTAANGSKYWVGDSNEE